MSTKKTTFFRFFLVKKWLTFDFTEAILILTVREREGKMATDLRSHAQDVSMTRFWGGDRRGVCVQVTAKRADSQPTGLLPDTGFDTVQLTRSQAAALAADLMDFAQGREQEDFGN